MIRMIYLVEITFELYSGTTKPAEITSFAAFSTECLLCVPYTSFSCPLHIPIYSWVGGLRAALFMNTT